MSEEASNASATASSKASTDTDNAPSSSKDSKKTSSVAAIKKAFVDTEVEHNGEKKSIWQSYKEIFSMADGGKSKATDDFVDTEAAALESIKAKIAAVKEHDKKNPHKWDFPWTPIKELNTTLDDVLLAFCKWPRKDDEDRRISARPFDVSNTM